MYCTACLKLCLSLCLIKLTICMNKGQSLESDIAQLMSSKGYIPDDKDLPRASIVKTSDSDSTYVLTKLSDEDLVKLLNEYPKRTEYDMDDLIKVSKDFSNNYKNDLQQDREVQNEKSQPIFRLKNKKVDPYVQNNDADPKYNALQNINNILYSRQKKDLPTENKQMIFDVLVTQLKALCCQKGNEEVKKASSLTNQKKLKNPTEYIFLVVNDDVKSNTTEEIIRVDPESLSKNSSVLLLGPITTPLSDMHMKLVMSRLSNELSRAEYLPLLSKISEGSLGKQNSDILKSFISGPNTRRYFKPHRCNHQSKLTKVYGGPKWIICTGYLNLNTPSYYD